MMRYFFVSYAHSAGFGNIKLQLEEFPNEVAIIKTLEDETEIPEHYREHLKSISVISIYEFKTKEDFDSFNRVD